MSEVILQIDQKEVRATEGMTVLDAAKKAGISIPTLCHHEKLEPYGACRLCMVEVVAGGRTRLVASCLYPVEPGLVVATRSPLIDKIRRVLIEEMMAHAPDSWQLEQLAKEYGADRDRFEKEPSFCIHCGLCVRYCQEIKKKNALGFIDRGARREISFIPRIAAKECWNCKECFELCPTSALQAAFVLVQALTPTPEPPE
ncbi:MAG: 2Fe-2S iron-sulfur cluster-binding protein [Syntrophobacteraceae bacterium]|nr:2Fe-2S iron-sulfur cluster-binding protein [Syntrophobacteraceae bacterium]